MLVQELHLHLMAVQVQAEQLGDAAHDRFYDLVAKYQQGFQNRQVLLQLQSDCKEVRGMPLDVVQAYAQLQKVIHWQLSK